MGPRLRLRERRSRERRREREEEREIIRNYSRKAGQRLRPRVRGGVKALLKGRLPGQAPQHRASGARSERQHARERERAREGRTFSGLLSMKEKVGSREARHTYGVCARGIVGEEEEGLFQAKAMKGSFLARRLCSTKKGGGEAVARRLSFFSQNNYK